MSHLISELLCIKTYCENTSVSYTLYQLKYASAIQKELLSICVYNSENMLFLCKRVFSHHHIVVDKCEFVRFLLGTIRSSNPFDTCVNVSDLSARGQSFDFSQRYNILLNLSLS